MYYDGAASPLPFSSLTPPLLVVPYSDRSGQFDDAAMNLAVALTAADNGASIANHVEVLLPKPPMIDPSRAHVQVRALLKDADARVVGARAVDVLTGGWLSAWQCI